MSNEGSLLRLFNCEGFTLEMLLQYLHKREESGILSYLINKLYEYPAHEIEFYIPQLVYQYFFKPGCEDLEKLLLNASIKFHSFALNLHCNLTAFLGDCKAEYTERAQSFLENLDMEIVNAVMPKQPSDQPPPHLYYLATEEDELELFNRKNVRSDYYSYQMKIINLLCKISVGLNTIPQDQRDEKLASWLESVNNTISDTRNKYANSSGLMQKLFRGPILNFKFNYNIDEKVTQVVKILCDKSFCFCTKARVPYKILFETIDLDEEDLEKEILTIQADNNEKIEELNVVDVESINKMMDKDDRFEGYDDYVKQAENNEIEGKINSSFDRNNVNETSAGSV